MEVHRFEKVWFVASLLLIAAFVGTVVYGSIGAGVAMVDDGGGNVDPDAIADGNFDQTDGFREPGVYRTGENRYDVYVVAAQFYFNPGSTEAGFDPIAVPAGSTVTFHVTSGDVTHGFHVTGTNVNTMVIPGQVAELTVEFEEPADYDIVCHEYCGAGHHTMLGNLTVQPQSEFDPETLEG